MAKKRKPMSNGKNRGLLNLPAMPSLESEKSSVFVIERELIQQGEENIEKPRRGDPISLFDGP